MIIALKEIRIRKKLSQQKLANLIGRDRSQVARYESGKVNIPISVLFDLAKILKVNVNKIMMEDK